MKTIFLLLLLPLLVGCEGLKRITEGADAEPPRMTALPDDYTVTGVTVTDFQIIEMPIQGRTVTVSVRKPGEAYFRPLYRDDVTGEFKTKFGPPSDSLWLRREVIKDGSKYSFSGPVAPTGTEYRIRSVLNEGGNL